MLSFSLFFVLPTAVVSFMTPGGRTPPLTPMLPSRRSFKFFFSTNEEDAYDDNMDIEDAEDEIEVKPYRNRSMSWTMRYRQLNPYEQARARVISFGHRSKEDWDEAVSSGQLGQYVPNHPDEMYAPEWVSWDEWLGIMRSYDETKHIATKVLRLKSLDEYLIFIKCNAKRAEGLRIPARPDIYYDEWINEESFFGQGRENDGDIHLNSSFQ